MRTQPDGSSRLRPFATSPEHAEAAVVADGTYVGQSVYDAVAANHPGAIIVIPPRSPAVARQNENPT
jgi:hypothetical protein